MACAAGSPALIGDAAEVALTGSTTDGVNAVLHALDLRPGDEILTSDEEHPGVLAPLARARQPTGACGWPVRRARGRGRPDAPGGLLARVLGHREGGGRRRARRHGAPSAARRRPGARRGAGRRARARLRLLRRLRPEVALRAEWHRLPVRARGAVEGLRAPGRATRCSRPARPLESPLKPDARKLGNGFPAHHQLEWAHASLDVLEEAGLAALQERAARLADSLAARLAELGVRVAPRGRQPLVSFEAATRPSSSSGSRRRSAWCCATCRVRGVRASVGAWTGEEELERLVRAVAP